MDDSYGAFENNTNLKTLTFKEPSQVETIGSRAFKGCSLLRVVVVPPSVVRIQGGAFWDTNLKRIYIMSTTSNYNSYEVNELTNAIQCSTGVKVFLAYGNKVKQSQIDSLTDAGCEVIDGFSAPTEEPTDEPTEEPTEEPTAKPNAAPTVAPAVVPVPVPVAAPVSTATGGGGGVPTVPVTSDATNIPELKFAYTLILRHSPTSVLTAALANGLEEWAAKTLSIERKNIVVFSSALLKSAKRKHLEDLFFLVVKMDIVVRSNEAFDAVNDLFLEKLRGDMLGNLGVDKDMELVAIMPDDSDSEITNSSNEAAPTESPSVGVEESVGDESTTSSSSSSSSSGGTSAGELAGIVIGAAVAALGFGIGLYNYNSRKTTTSTTDGTISA